MVKHYLLIVWILFISNLVTCTNEPTSDPIVDPYFPVQDTYKVGMIIYDQLNMLDLLGPVEVLGFNKTLFNCTMIGKHGNAVVNSHANQVKFMTDLSIDEAINEDWDMIIIPGGFKGADIIRKDDYFIQKLKTLANRSKVVFTICTGAIVLAQTGLLDGISATTNKKRFFLTNEFSNVKWIHKSRWVHNKKYITTSGVSAGMDGAVYVMSLAVGKEAAKVQADGLEYGAQWDPKEDLFAR